MIVNLRNKGWNVQLVSHGLTNFDFKNMCWVARIILNPNEKDHENLIIRVGFDVLLLSAEVQMEPLDTFVISWYITWY